jgi:polar amino acid transport system permease protein
MSFLEVTSFLFDGFLISLLIFAVTLLCGAPLGLPIAFCSMSRFRVVKSISKVFVWIIRGVPLMLQIFIIYYVPGLLFDTPIFSKMDRFFFINYGVSDAGRVVAVLIAFTINYACYFSEIYRGGIESIPQGQYEAGQVLGMTKSQIFFKVVLLQVVKRIMAPMSNEVITLVKDTSLARVIGIYEIIWAGESFIKKGLIWPLFFTGVFYLVFSGGLTILFGYLEKKLDYFRG